LQQQEDEQVRALWEQAIQARTMSHPEIPAEGLS
jgi:hypothetical protein